MNNKKALMGLLALIVELGLYVCLYTLFATFAYGELNPAEASSMQFVWYAFIVIAVASNIFDPLLYLQILIWGIIIKYTYNNEYPCLCLSALGIGLTAITANIALRKRIKKVNAPKKEE